MSKFHKFLEKIRDTTNWLDVSRKAGIPRATISKHFGGHAPLPEKHIPKIVRVLCETYGCIEIDGWTIRVDHDGPAIFASKAIPGRKIETVEVDGNFEYIQHEWREVYDDFDFATYFCG